MTNTHKQAQLAARAEQQNAWVLTGDRRGLHGDYPLNGEWLSYADTEPDIGDLAPNYGDGNERAPLFENPEDEDTQFGPQIWKQAWSEGDPPPEVQPYLEEEADEDEADDEETDDEETDEEETDEEETDEEETESASLAPPHRSHMLVSRQRKRQLRRVSLIVILSVATVWVWGLVANSRHADPVQARYCLGRTEDGQLGYGRYEGPQCPPVPSATETPAASVPPRPAASAPPPPAPPPAVTPIAHGHGSFNDHDPSAYAQELLDAGASPVVFTAEGARKLAADLCDKHNHGDPHSRPAIPPESDGQWLTPGLDWNPGPIDRAKIFGAEYHFCPESRLNPGPFSNEDENASAYAQELWASGISEDKLAALEGFWDGGRYYPPPSISPIGNAYHLAQDVCRWKQSQSASDSVEGLSKRGVSTKDAELIVSRGRFHFCPDPVAPTEHEYGS